MDLVVVENKHNNVNTDVKLAIVSDIPLCKISGEPQHYDLYIRYKPKNLFIGMREVQKLINSILDEPTDLETLVQFIASELSQALQTSVQVRGFFVLSGGVELDVEAISHILRRTER